MAAVVTDFHGNFYWSKKCRIQYRNFASYIPNLLAERSVRRVLDAENKFGTPNVSCKYMLWATRELREMRSVGMLWFHFSLIPVPCKRRFTCFESIVGCTVFGVYV